MTNQANAQRMLAILENQRILEAEPKIRLADYLQSKDPAVRTRAALAAGRIGNKAVFPDLKRLVNDQIVDVRRMTAFAVGQIPSKDGLALLPVLLKDVDPEVRRLALEASGRIGGLEATSLVIPFLNDDSALLREQAALALALIKDKSTVDLLISKCSADDPAQWSYVYALYRLADERSVPVLHKVLEDPAASPSTGDPSSLLFALKSLWSLKKPLSGEETERLLKHEDQRVQQNALDVLAAAGDHSACSALRAHLPDLPLQSKWKALDALGTLQCATVEEKVKNFVVPQPELRASALKLIGDKEVETYLPVFERASHDESWVVRTAAAESCRRLSFDSAMPLLKRLILDPDSAVRLAAIESLGNFLPRAEGVLLPFLQSTDSPARAVAADALGKTKDPKYLNGLIEAFKAHSDPDTRITIIDILADAGDSRALILLEPSLKDSRFIVRKHAIDALKKLNDGDSYFFNGSAINLQDFMALRGKVSLAAQNKYPADFGSALPSQAVIQLQKGPVTIRLLHDETPLHVANFKHLIESGYYNGLRIHRVVPNFVIQGGDKRGDGWGGSEELLVDQFTPRPFMRGTIGMPTSGKDSGGTQFFITMSRQPHLDGNYTVFAVVTAGMEYVDATELGDRIENVKLLP